MKRVLLVICLWGSSIFEGATILEDAKTNINVLERLHKLFSNDIKATQKELETEKANYVRFQDISGFDSDTLDSLTLDSQLMYLSKNYICFMDITTFSIDSFLNYYN